MKTKQCFGRELPPASARPALPERYRRRRFNRQRSNRSERVRSRSRAVTHLHGSDTPQHGEPCASARASARGSPAEQVSSAAFGRTDTGGRARAGCLQLLTTGRARAPPDKPHQTGCRAALKPSLVPLATGKQWEKTRH